MNDLTKSIKLAKLQFKSRQISRHQSMNSPQSASSQALNIYNKRAQRMSSDLGLTPTSSFRRFLTPTNDYGFSPSMRRSMSWKRVPSYKLDAVKLLDSRMKEFLLKHMRIWKRQTFDICKRIIKTSLPSPIKRNLLSPWSPQKLPMKPIRQNISRFDLIQLCRAISNHVIEQLKTSFDNIKSCPLVTRKMKKNEEIKHEDLLVSVNLQIVLDHLIENKKRAFFTSLKKWESTLERSSSIRFGIIKNAIRQMCNSHKQMLGKAFTKWTAIPRGRVRNDVKKLVKVINYRKQAYSEEFWWKTIWFISLKTRYISNLKAIVLFKLFKYFQLLKFN